MGYALSRASWIPSKELSGSAFSSGASNGYMGADLTHTSNHPISFTLYSLLDLHHYDHLSLWAAFMVAFFGFLRSKELLNLRWQDLERHQEGFPISITASKTDPFTQGAVVEIKESGDRALCVVRAWIASASRQLAGWGQCSPLTVASRFSRSGSTN